MGYDFDDAEETTEVTTRRFEAALEDAETAKRRAAALEAELEREIRKYLEEK